MNIKTIIEAWVIAHNPTEKQKEIAEERAKVCERCDARKKLASIHYCKKCGCPIAKKIFTNSPNPCPLKKWDDVDSQYFKIKKKKTLL